LLGDDHQFEKKEEASAHDNNNNIQQNTKKDAGKHPRANRQHHSPWCRRDLRHKNCCHYGQKGMVIEFSFECFIVQPRFMHSDWGHQD
jgi:hypothetical protein